jgi:hypothetical protein
MAVQGMDETMIYMDDLTIKKWSFAVNIGQFNGWLAQGPIWMR